MHGREADTNAVGVRFLSCPRVPLPAAAVDVVAERPQSADEDSHLGRPCRGSVSDT